MPKFTAGQLMIEEALPEKYRGRGIVLDGKTTGKVMTELAKELSPEDYVETLQRLNDIGREVVTAYGREASLSLDDLEIPPEIMQKREALRSELRKIRNSDMLDEDQKEQAVSKTVSRFASTIDTELLEAAKKADNSFARQIESGTRGKPAQLRQMLLGGLSVPGARGRPIPHIALEGFAEGLSPMSYWAMAHGGRKGFVDLQFATSDSGYLSKQLANVGHRVVVTMEDCGASSEGLPIDGDDKDNIGAVLAADAGGLKKGTVITEENMPLLAGRQILVRSPITCRAKEGVCSHCSGIREKGDFPAIGDPIGINAVRSFAEPLTQAAIGSKHVAEKLGRAGQPEMSGFRQVNQVVQVPKEFAGGAVLAKAHGTVADIRKAPQGGWEVKIGQELHHIPVGLEMKVKRGDKVEAGDVLTDGMVNPEELVKYKGIGDGRVYFMNQMRDILDKSGASTSRRNLELLSRAFISRVQVTDPEGYSGHLVDDVIDYNMMAADWKPRASAKLKSTTTANKLYLERPYLNYSIGTRMTPGISKTLRKHGIGKVLVNDQPPPFEPAVFSARSYTQTDRDWLTSLAGENLRRVTLENAARGGTSEKRSTSYYPQLVNIADTKL